MKKIYTIAFAVLAFGTLSAQTNNTGQTNAKTKAKKAPAHLETITSVKDHQKSAATVVLKEQKAIENKKRTKKSSK